MDSGIGISFSTSPDDTAPDRDTEIPLVLDVDGTLLSTDMLYETFWAALGQSFLATLIALVTCWTSPARLKARLREIAAPDIDLLPVNRDLLDLARAEIDRGRAVCLASAADRGLVETVADRLGLAGDHAGSHGDTNLKGAAKADLLVNRFGAGGYDYAGDARADLPCWASARKVIAVDPAPSLETRLRKMGKPVRILRTTRPAGTVLKEMRPRQWIKNLLLLLPALAAHELGPSTLLPVLMAMVAFSLGASSIYIVNDLLDLSADRRHPEKRTRPIAAGLLPIPEAMLASAGLGVAALSIAAMVSAPVALLTLGYMAGSLVYSLWLKKYRWLDVLALVGLFTLRVLAGAAAAQVTVSGWLLAFVFAVFLALACVKRLTELARAFRRGQLPGRGYSRRDFNVLRAVAYLGAAAAAAVFLLYAYSPAASAHYASAHLLGLAALPVAIWLARMVRLASLGEEDYDPVRFVARDRPGLAIAALGIAIVLLAI